MIKAEVKDWISHNAFRSLASKDDDDVVDKIALVSVDESAFSFVLRLTVNNVDGTVTVLASDARVPLYAATDSPLLTNAVNRLNDVLEAMDTVSLGEFLKMLRTCVWGRVEERQPTVDLGWLDHVADAPEPVVAPMSLGEQIVRMPPVSFPSNDAVFPISSDDMIDELLDWCQRHAGMSLAPLMDRDAFHVMVDVGVGAKKGNILFICDDDWRVFACSSSNPELIAPTETVKLMASEKALDPTRALAHVLATLRKNYEESQCRRRSTSGDGDSSFELDDDGAEDMVNSNQGMPAWARRTLPIAVRYMSDFGRPPFEIAERVRRVRIMLEAGKMEDAKRSVRADMFLNNVPPSCTDDLRTGADALRQERFGRGASRVKPEYRRVGTEKGRAWLACELEALQADSRALDKLGIEVRLVGTGRQAPASSGAPGWQQGDNLYHWAVWLYGFSNEATLQGHSLDEPARVSARALGHGLDAYNTTMRDRTTFAFLKSRYKRAHIHLELFFDVTQNEPRAPMVRVISPLLMASSAPIDNASVADLLTESTEGATFVQGADGKLHREEDEEERVLSTSVAFEMGTDWLQQHTNTRDLLMGLWTWLAGSSLCVDMDASLDPAGGLPTVGGFWKVLTCALPDTVANGKELEHSGKILLPPSTLDELMTETGEGRSALAALQAHAQHQGTSPAAPMLFELSCAEGGHRRTFCGVAEFTAPEGFVIVPEWLSRNAGLVELGRASIRRVELPRGTHLHLRPHDASFFVDGDAKAQLEWRLPHYPALTRGDVLQLSNGARLDVVDVKPGRSVSVIDTDIEVEFSMSQLPNGDAQPSAAVDGTSSSVFGGDAPETPAPTTVSTALAGQSLGGAASGVPCSNCRRNVPEAALAMHQLRCERLNYFCEDCDQVVERAEREAHEASLHVPTPCTQKCGESVMPKALADHVANSCSKRIVRCVCFEHCGIQLPAAELSEHESACQEKTEECEVCKERVPRKLIDEHLVICVSARSLEHAIHRVEARRPEVATPIGQNQWPTPHYEEEEEEDLFACPMCGVSHSFFDDLQVHMLTEHPE